MAKWAEYFGVSTSGYYAWRNRKEEAAERRSARQEKIRRIFEESCGTYGPERVVGILRQHGEKASRIVVRRDMAEMGLSSIHNRHRSRSLTDSRKARGDGYRNLMREVERGSLYETVCSDITYLKTDEGFDYLCVVKDVVSGEVLSEVTSSRMTKELVIKAFLAAQARYGLGAGVIFPSDRGSQYTSKAFQELLCQYGVRQSFSRVGRPGDNSWAESFFATLKKECTRWRRFETREELRQAVFAYIEGFYNPKRVQKRLGYLSPKQYVRSLRQAPPQLVA